MKSKKIDVTEPKESSKSKWEQQLDAKLVPVGWFVLLFVGLADLLPQQLESVLKINYSGISLQQVIGVVAVALALNFLFRD